MVKSVGHQSQNSTDAAKWADLDEIRDQINRAAYLSIPRLPLIPYILSGLFFVAIIELTRRAAYELVFEFILGSILLFVSQQLIRRIQNLHKLKVDGPLNASVLWGMNAPTLGILQSIMEMRGQRVSEFPIQQNALLVIALILLPSFDRGDRNSIYGGVILRVFFGVAYLAMKKWEDSRNQGDSWRNAARAIREVIRRM
ncbi:MAG: hypothetical protein HY074_15705 [Deltaproteobacteria bacterium]|nr:hypothetical protein [Deltaproteobacteria bacterium]